jgi:hypothetical protein
MKKVFLSILFFLMMVSMGWSAESLTQSIQSSGGSYSVYNLVWVTGAAGGFTATELSQPIDGIVILVEFIPSTTAAPTTLYDVTLRNSSGIDVLGDTGAAAGEVFDGAGANLSATVANESMPLLNGNFGAVPVMGKLTVDVLSAGNDKGGTIRIHYLSIN